MAEERAAAFLKSLQIKGTAIGGFDKTETFTKFKELAYIYEDILTNERSEKNQLQNEKVRLNVSLTDKESELDQLRKKICELETEKDELKQKVIAGADALMQKERSYSESDTPFIQSSEEVLNSAKKRAEAILSDSQREAEEILIRARSERDSILKTAHDDALRRRADLQNEVIALRNEKKTILTEFKVIQDQLAGVIRTTNDSGVFAE